MIIKGYIPKENVEGNYYDNLNNYPPFKLKIIYVQEFFLFVYFIMPKVLKNRKDLIKRIKRKS